MIEVGKPATHVLHFEQTCTYLFQPNDWERTYAWWWQQPLEYSIRALEKQGDHSHMTHAMLINQLCISKRTPNQRYIAPKLDRTERDQTQSFYKPKQARFSSANLHVFSWAPRSSDTINPNETMNDRGEEYGIHSMPQDWREQVGWTWDRKASTMFITTRNRIPFHP